MEIKRDSKTATEPVLTWHGTHRGEFFAPWGVRVRNGKSSTVRRSVLLPEDECPGSFVQTQNLDNKAGDKAMLSLLGARTTVSLSHGSGFHPKSRRNPSFRRERESEEQSIDYPTHTIFTIHRGADGLVGNQTWI